MECQPVVQGRRLDQAGQLAGVPLAILESLRELARVGGERLRLEHVDLAVLGMEGIQGVGLGDALGHVVLVLENHVLQVDHPAVTQVGQQIIGVVNVVVDPVAAVAGRADADFQARLAREDGERAKPLLEQQVVDVHQGDVVAEAGKRPIDGRVPARRPHDHVVVDEHHVATGRGLEASSIERAHRQPGRQDHRLDGQSLMGDGMALPVIFIDAQDDFDFLGMIGRFVEAAEKPAGQIGFAPRGEQKRNQRHGQFSSDAAEPMSMIHDR